LGCPQRSGTNEASRCDSDREERRDWWLSLIAEGDALHPDFLATLRHPQLGARDVMSAPVVSIAEKTEGIRVGVSRSVHGGSQAEDQRSWDDLQECDLPVLKAKEEPQIDWAARKVAGQPARNDRRPVTVLQGKRFAAIGVFARGFVFPLLDGHDARVGAAFVLHRGVFREAPRDGLAVSFVGGEIGGDRFRKFELFGHDGLHQLAMRPEWRLSTS
jgi:hypothetical protein